MFDPFKFLEDRKAGLPVDESDKDQFVLFNVVQAISMDYRFRRLTHMANEISFSHLPRDIQASAFNSLNKVNIDTRWHRAKTSAIRENEENIEKAMKILKMSHSGVIAAMKYKLIDMNAVNDAYTLRYEPDKLLARNTGRKKK